MNFVIPLRIYPFDIMFSFGQSDDEIEKELSEQGISLDNEGDCWKYANEHARGRTCVFSGGQTIVRMRRKPRTPEDYGTLSHEIFHAVDFLLYRVGIKLTRKSDEAYAYLIGYVTEQVFYRLKSGK